MGVPNLAALHFQSLTPVSSLLPSANHLDLSVVRVSVPMSLLAGRGVLLCSTSGRPVLPSTVRIGVYVVLHPLCGDWPSLWSIGLTMFLRVPTQHSWPLMLPHCSIASGCFYCRSLQFVFLHVTVLLAHHWASANIYLGNKLECTVCAQGSEQDHNVSTPSSPA